MASSEATVVVEDDDDPRGVRKMKRGGVRERILGHYLSVGKSRNWDLRSDGQVSPSRYMRLMRDSKFCLHVRGTRVQSPRLIEGMLFGCVPVIIADGYVPPLSWLFDWSKFSVR